ncbi:MAG TPA: hypothetical protein VNL14_17415 [Candidatus Acidoferrales bacterium]|nr:hypothetical protein [Candidatus Acidoferrales bacterium]
MPSLLIRRLVLIVGLTATFVSLFPSSGFSQAPFYQGKTVTVIASATLGGTGDLRVRAVVPFLRKYIPGNPTVVIEYMDGAGGRKAANYVFNTARPDGLTVFASSGSVLALAVLGESGVLYDIDKFIYLGAPESTAHYVIYTRKDLGLNTIEKLRAASGLRIGAQSVGHVSYVAGRLFAYFMDLKEPKFITGYQAPEVDVALMRKELDARANSATSVVRRNPDWLEKNLMDFHSILEIPKGLKHPNFSQVPEIESFARSEKEVKLLSMWRTFRLIGSPYILPPGTPKDRVEILREAMRKTFKDPSFPAEYKKIVGEDATPLMPEEVAKAIRELPRDREIGETLKAISSAGPLPPR